MIELFELFELFILNNNFKTNINKNTMFNFLETRLIFGGDIGPVVKYKTNDARDADAEIVSKPVIKAKKLEEQPQELGED